MRPQLPSLVDVFVQSNGSITLKPSELEVTFRVEGKFCARLAFKSSSYCACVLSICLWNASVSDSVSSAFCFENASTMDLVCWATALVTILASAASLDSWSRLWSLFSAVEEFAAFSSLDQSLPITRSEDVSKTRTQKVGQYCDVINNTGAGSTVF